MRTSLRVLSAVVAFVVFAALSNHFSAPVFYFMAEFWEGTRAVSAFLAEVFVYLETTSERLAPW